MFFGKKRSTGDPNLAEVYIASGVLEAEIVKGRLEANDIPALLKYESLGPVMGLTVDGLGQVQVLVPKEYAEQASALLAEHMDVEDIPWEGPPDAEE